MPRYFMNGFPYVFKVFGSFALMFFLGVLGSFMFIGAWVLGFLSPSFVDSCFCGVFNIFGSFIIVFGFTRF